MIYKQKYSKHSLALVIIAAFLTILFTAQPVGAEENSPAAQNIFRSFKNPFVSFLPQKPAEPIAEAPVVEETGKISTQPPTLQVNGIVWNTDRPQAIINSYVVGIGDIIAEARIIDITRRGVSFEYQGKRFIIDPNKNVAEPIEQIN